MPSLFSILCHSNPRVSHSFPTRRSSDLLLEPVAAPVEALPRQIKADHRFVFAQTRIDAQIRIALADRGPGAHIITQPVHHGVFDFQRTKLGVADSTA